MSENLGKTIGEYQLIEFVGETDNAIVYKGFQPSMNRYVAVKVLKPGAARDPAAVQQYLQQSGLAAQLTHPNILPVYDSGQQGDVVYQVSQLAEAGTLRDRLSEFYNPQQALVLVSGLVEGLEYIHSQGYVHGNLKPSNIFMDATRRPLLADFGVPQVTGATPSPYMAPEQTRGGIVDRRADVYALGVLLFEMLVGEAPPAGMVVSPRAKRPDLPEAVERVILRAVAQNPDQRFQSVREFQGALNTAVQQPAPAPIPTPVPPPSGVSQSVHVEQQKGTNWLAIIFGVILVGIICLGAVYFVPRLLGEATETPPAVGQPTQPPVEVTVVIPTREPKPTEPPEQPTEPPEEPTQPPEGPEEPTEPGEPPGEGPPGDICGSVGFVFAAAVFWGAASYKKHRRK